MVLEKPTAAETQQITDQLARILAESNFRASKRSSAFLTFVVEEALAGNLQLKERLIGAAVFGREPAYDTAVDHVVRTAATELRKRLALYYSDSRHADEIVISLTPGSYVPRFQPSRTVSSPATSPGPVITVEEQDSDGIEHDESADQNIRAPRRQRKPFSLRDVAVWLCLSLVVAAVAGAALRFARPAHKEVGIEAFFGPADRVLACVGAPSLKENQPRPESPTGPENLGVPAENNVLVPFSDARALDIASSVVQTSGRKFRAELARSCNFSDLRSGPTFLIGALDNPWTLRLMQEAPFRFEGRDNAVGTLYLLGKTRQKIGEVNFTVPYSDRTHDFGVLSLFQSETSRQPTIVIAGIGPNGTLAAAELFADSRRLSELLTEARRSTGKPNVTFALATQVIDGRSGQPTIVATLTW